MSHSPSKSKRHTKAERAADKLGITSARRHIFICCDLKETGCASRKRMTASWEYLKKRLKELKLTKAGGVYRTKSQCFDICGAGPIAVVWPDGIWYGHCNPDVLERIIQEHLIAGRVVDEYVIARSPGRE